MALVFLIKSFQGVVIDMPYRTVLVASFFFAPGEVAIVAVTRKTNKQASGASKNAGSGYLCSYVVVVM